MIVIERYMTEDLKLGGSELLVYADIVSNINACNECVKLQKTIAADCGITVKTVYSCIKRLEALKLIKTKSARDGRRMINIMIVCDKHTDMIRDEGFNTVLDYYKKKLHLLIDKCNKNYTAYLSMIKQPDYTQQKFMDAISCYSDTINDQDYYKTHLYTFDSFTTKYRLYLPSGYEYEQYAIFYNNRKHKGDSSYYIGIFDDMHSGLLSEEELGHVEV